MRITYGPWGESTAELTTAARVAERAGAAALWSSELHRTATISTAVLAAATRSVEVGTAITLAFTRSPMTIAMEALDLDELSGGRYVLGLGSGVRRLVEDWHHGRWGRPVAHLRETVGAVRTFWAGCADGDPIVFDGEFEPMCVRGYQRPFPLARKEIPIYLAAMGPEMTRLAGEIGDGWISHELCSPRWVRERGLPRLHEGVARVADRPRATVDVVVSACCSIDPDPAVARQRAAGLVGFYASVATYADLFAFHDLAAEQAVVREAFRGGRAADGLGEVVPHRAVDTLTLCGTREQVRARLSEYEGLADTVKLTPPTHGLPAADIRAAQAEIIQLIAELAAERAE